MHSITSLASKLQADFCHFSFVRSTEFRWSPPEKTIYYSAANEPATLLHELSHAILNHQTYKRDIELVELERDAWEYAVQTLAPRYSIAIPETIVEESLDTYRDWLHARSTCPRCKAIGVQTKKDRYKCLACSTTWRVNDARACALRRYKTN